MYGLPEDFDASFLVGLTLEMVCFAQYQVYLHFNEKAMITIMGTFSYKTDSIISTPVLDSNLMELTGCAVLNANGTTDGTLSLLFDNGQTLRIYDANKQYESYTVAFRGKEIVI